MADPAAYSAIGIEVRMPFGHWVGSRGFVSFSESWRSPLTRAHYAEDHKGVCLGIDAVFDMTRLETAVDDEVFKTIATTKFKEWEYEREWRMLVTLEDPDPDTGSHYVEFSPDFELCEILMGARCDAKLEKIRERVFGIRAQLR